MTRRTVPRLLPVAVAGTAGCSAGDGPLLADGFERGLDPWRRGPTQPAASGGPSSAPTTAPTRGRGASTSTPGRGADAPLGGLGGPLGVEAVHKTLASADVDTRRVQLVDGSGLPRQNLLRPQSVLRPLQLKSTHPDAAVSTAFYDALPKGGEDGTLEYRFQGNAPARSSVRAKTGTLSNVSSLSGYVTSERGTPLAFSVFCNHHLADGDDARSAQDVIVNALARLPL